MDDVEKQEASSSRTLSHSSASSAYGLEDTLSKAGTNTSADLDLSRTISRRETTISRLRSRAPIGRFSHPLGHVKTSEADLVDFEGPDDPYRPLNWSLKKKIITTALYGLTTMTATWASSIYSSGQKQIGLEFGISNEVSTLGTTLFLFGLGLGPLLWAPLSEVYGRKNAVLPPMFVAAMFSIGTATAKDIQTIMITRFFAGFFGSAPVTNTGGVLGDIFTPDHRGYGLAGYAIAVAGGPLIGPVVGASLVAQPSLGWRWTEYLTAMMQLAILVADVIFLDESYSPQLLVLKSRRLRHETGNWALHAKFEEWDVSIKELATKFLVRPFQLIATPICFLVALYASFVYGILYMQLGAVPIIFEEHRGWKPVPATLPFIAVLIGVFAGCAANVYNQKIYNVKFHEAGDRAVPEARLPPMMFGGVFLAGGLFITGWTADPKFPWIAPVLGLFCLGFGFFTIFQAALNYLVDTFTRYAASAVGANTFLRSCFAGAFPLIVAPMYHNLGVGWASSLCGFLAVGLIPVPFFFYVYGKRIRARGKWSKDSVF